MKKQVQKNNKSSLPLNSTNNQQKKQFILSKYINQQQILNKKIANVPLQFEYLPVQILSKQFTKLNNNHNYRIHYLGPRYKNTIDMHKKNAYNFKKPYVYKTDLMKKYQQNIQNSGQTIFKQEFIKNVSIKQKQIQKYKIDHLKIYNSYILQEKLKKTQYFKSTIYYRAFEGMNPTLCLENQFIFNSCFEGGNLDCAIKISHRQFDLFLRIDSNTRGHLFWFYFSIKNGNNLGKIKMNLVNLSKSKSLYEQGMKPYVFSSYKFKKFNNSWSQNGINLGFQKKQLRYEILKNKKNEFLSNCLSIQYDFQHQDDQVFFAYCIPYTYSQLCSEILQLPNKYVTKSYLGKSFLGTPIPLLYINQDFHQTKISATQAESLSTMTNFYSQFQEIKTKEKKSKFEENNKYTKINKKIIFITGRIHPSQSNSSIALMGFIKWICSQEKQAIQIRKIARFIIIPMVNPDGVILGNSRTSAAGKDLNRQYINPDPFLYPEVYQLKQLAKKIHSQYKIDLFLDFHGHSRKKNTFFYGPVYSISQPNYYKSRILPKFIQNIQNSFRYHSCSFTIIDQKKRTARAFMFQDLAVPYTYTIQTSIGYYYDSQKHKILQFSFSDWINIGSAIAQGVAIFIIGIMQYDLMIQQKRKNRQKTKTKIRYLQTKIDYLEDGIYLQFNTQQNSKNYKEQTLRINYSQKQIKKTNKSNHKNSNYFIEMLNQLCLNTLKNPNPNHQKKQKNFQKLQQTIIDGKQKYYDKDQQSDSHDQKEDMQQKILNQFKYVIKCSGIINQQQLKKNKKQNIQLIAKTQKLTDKTIDDEFKLLQQFRMKKNTSPQIIVKTSDCKRNYSSKINNCKMNRQKTAPQQDISFNKLVQNDNNNGKIDQTKLFNRTIYTSLKKNILNQKTVPKFFGQFHLLVDQAENYHNKKKQKADLVKKIQNKKQKQRKSRIQCKNINLSNNFNSINLKKLDSNQQTKESINFITQPLNLSIPKIVNSSEYLSTSHYRPKLKLNIRNNRSNSISIKHFSSYSTTKRENQQSSKTLNYINSKLQSSQSQIKQQNKIQAVFGRRGLKSQKGTYREAIKDKKICTTINLNQIGKAHLIHSSHMRIFNF